MLKSMNFLSGKSRGEQGEAAPPFAASFFAGTPCWKYHGGESITPLRMQCQYALPLATRSWILVCHSLRGVATSMTFRVGTVDAG